MRLAPPVRRPGRPAPGHRAFPALILVSDAVRLPDPRAAMARLGPGCGVILRRPAVPMATLAALAGRLRLVLMVAGDWRMAARIGACGLHLSERMARHGVLAPALGWRRRRGALLSVACHGRAALGRAARLGADAAILSPVFATPSHPGAPVLGPVRFGLWARAAGLPVVALGGLNAGTARRLAPGSAAGLAAIGALSG